MRRTVTFLFSGLILTTYCVRYPRAMPFLRNKMPFSRPKTPKIYAVQGLQRSKCPEFGKRRGKNPQLCPFTGLSCPFLVIRTHALIFQNKPWFCRTKEKIVFCKKQFIRHFSYSKRIHKILNYKPVCTFPDKCQKKKVAICNY